MTSSLFRLLRSTRTALALGGGISRTAKLAYHVLRTEGPAGIAWRLRNAKNLADGRVDPWQQFFPEDTGMPLFPVERLARLWSGEDESLLQDLQALAQSKNRASLPKPVVSTLARWHARSEQWHEVAGILAPTIPSEGNRLAAIPLETQLLWATALMRLGQFKECHAFLNTAEAIQTSFDDRMDLQLARANLVQLEGRAGGEPQATTTAQWIKAVNRGLQSGGLAQIALTSGEDAITMAALATEPCATATQEGPLVTVIVSAFNAESTLAMALQSLISQTWQPLEVLVIDDCSTDATAAVAASFAQRDRRVRLIRAPVNMGAYGTRNLGLQQAKGQFITTHDSDDWSHAQKIEKQVQTLLAEPQRLISFSQWSRATEDLVFGGWHTPENWEGWVHRNASSLMMRRAVFERLGYWDNVRSAADTEYHCRAIRVFGAHTVADTLPGVALSFGMVSANSLTQRSDIHVFSAFGGVLKDYEDAFRAWHQQFDPRDPSSLYLEERPTARPFAAPDALLRK